MDFTAQFGKKLLVRDDVKIAIDGKDYFYFMTNNYAVISAKLAEYGCRKPYSFDSKINTALSPLVRQKMTELGVCWSLTVSNGAECLNYYIEGREPQIIFLRELRKSCKNECIEQAWNEISKHFSNIWQNPKMDSNVLSDWDYAFFCANLVQGKSASYYLYLIMNYSHSQVAYSLGRFSDVLNNFIAKFLKTGNKISDIYKRAGMTKQTFSRLRSGDIEHPTMKSVLQLAIGLKLPYFLVLVLVDSAGVLNELREKVASTVIAEIVKQNYDIYSINQKLYENCGTTL